MVSKSFPIVTNGRKMPVIGKSINTQTKANMLRTNPYQVDSIENKKYK